MTSMSLSLYFRLVRISRSKAGKRETEKLNYYHVLVRFYSVHLLQQKLSSLVTSKHLTPPMLRDIMEETCVILFDELKSHSCTDTKSIASESNNCYYVTITHHLLFITH